MILSVFVRIMRPRGKYKGQPEMETPRPTMATDSPQARFQTLLDRHQKIVFKVANTYGPNYEDRRDLVQEISVQLWRAFPRYDPRRSFSTWMYRIALNVAISFARRAGHRKTELLPKDDLLAGPTEASAAEQERDDRSNCSTGNPGPRQTAASGGSPFLTIQDRARAMPIIIQETEVLL